MPATATGTSHWLEKAEHVADHLHQLHKQHRYDSDC